MPSRPPPDEWAWLDELLYGIDKDQCDDERGWWETSTGAGFGATKLAELKATIRHNLFAPDKDAWIAGWLAAAQRAEIDYPDAGIEEAEYAWRHREDLAKVTDTRRSEAVERVNENLRADGFTIPYDGRWYTWDMDAGEWGKP